MSQHSKPPIRILTVDDHPLLREGIAAILQLQQDMELVGEAEDGKQAVEIFHRLKPDVTLMDLQMPVLGGVEAITRIRSDFPGARIIVLTTYAGDVQALRAMRAGAAGYLLKGALRRELLDTIRAVHAGRRYLQPEIAQRIALHSSEDSLSEKEIGVLKLVATGKANKEIAGALAVSEDTVKAHLKSVFAKLGVSDRTQAVTLALKRGIIEL
ncbi:MAG: two component transcriptional regulator, LuxR family [Alphaproteobacteria bacterium]|nr:two component transcriptional regulator, LuxR family [Alphaproteobacteria bacterium]MDB5740301.1 two component transcriptional regulator, LuxR family [Alphaproteobacteria bacterium]